MIFKKIVYFSLYFLGFCFYHQNLFAFAYPYERMEMVKDLERDYKSLKIVVYTPFKDPQEKLFLPHYWKVYYQKDKIVGEELFEKGRMTYYYVYYYDKNKIYQKGFVWYGIYLDIGVFKAHKKRIKQGWMYKNLPDCYRVFDATTQKLIYAYYYPNKEI
jgi:hypothetical protein